MKATPTPTYEQELMEHCTQCGKEIERCVCWDNEQ